MLKDTWQKATLNFLTYFYLRKFNKESQLPGEEVRKIQFTRLKAFLCDVYQTHPFYRERFDASQFDPFKMVDLRDYKKVLILEKDDYRTFIKSQIEQDEKHYRNWYKEGTSGSTGIPLRILRTWNERAYMSAKWMRVLVLNGYNWRDVTFSLPSPHRLQRDSVVQRFGILKRYTVAYTAPVENMVEMYLKVRPSVVYANKTHLVLMALYCEQNKIKLPKPHLCISVAETMDGRSKAVIENCFGAENLIEAYGAVEFGIIAWQKKGEDFFNFSHTTNYLEVLDENGRDKNFGRCIITDLYIRSFPLIRYNLGDILDNENKNGLPIIKKIRGRQDDWIIFADGERMPFHAFYEIMERRQEIKQFRIIQEDFNKIYIQVVKELEADKSELEKTLLTDLHREVRDKDIEYIIDFVDNIPPDPNGKIRMLISKIN